MGDDENMTETLDNIQLRIDAAYQQIENIEKHIAELEAEKRKEARKNSGDMNRAKSIYGLKGI